MSLRSPCGAGRLSLLGENGGSNQKPSCRRFSRARTSVCYKNHHETSPPPSRPLPPASAHRGSFPVPWWSIRRALDADSLRADPLRAHSIRADPLSATCEHAYAQRTPPLDELPPKHTHTHNLANANPQSVANPHNVANANPERP